MEGQIEEIFRNLLGLEKDYVLKDELSSASIEQWDSLSHVRLMAELESHFQIEFEFDEMLELNSLGSIKKIVDKKVSEKKVSKT